MKLINIGFGNLISAERIISIVSPESAPIKRMVQDVREKGLLIDASFGRSTKSVIVMDSGNVVLSALPPETLAAVSEIKLNREMAMKMNDKGRLFVISGPSGAGKSTVVFKAIEGRDDMCFSTSVTTRKPRPNEVDGREYFFVDLDRFREMVENDELLEHAEYVANSYGTPRKYVEDKLESGLNVLLDIEVQGARQIKAKKPDAVFVFIIPPSMEELRRRLVARGTDSERAIEARLIRARQEYAEADFYDYIIVNDDAERAAKELSAIITAERCKAENRINFLKEA